MPLRNSRPVKWRPKGVSDSIDGTNAFPGAMTALSNLIPSSTTPGAFVPRPAAVQLTTFPGFSAPAEINCIEQVGPILYGMIAETGGPFAGKDVPFSYNVLTSAFNPVTIPGGVASLPTTPPTSGDWTPPTAAIVASRVLFTHPGFAGATTGDFFGWLDISSFSDATVTGTTNSTTTVSALSANVIENGWQVGMLIAGAGILANTTIKAIDASALDLNTTGTFNGTNTITGIGSLTGVVVGSQVFVGGVFIGFVQSLPGGGASVVLDRQTPSGLTGGSGIGLNFTGGTSLTLSQAATAGAGGVALTVTGGTPAAPLWGAGNTNTNPLVAVPLAVAEFFGRAYFAVLAGVQFSDSGTPCQITFATQALEFQNGLPVTALAGLPLEQTLGGLLQALIAFQGDTTMQQITGDSAFANLQVNQIGIGIGTLAPNTICNTAMGMAFIAPDGLRILNFSGNISEPIGADGEGVCAPFLNAIAPSRMCAAYNQNVLRISVQNGALATQAHQEWWFDFKVKGWTGPHTSAAALIAAFQGSNNGFTVILQGVNAQIFSSRATPTINDTYVENGTALTWVYQTTLLPDNDEMVMNALTMATLSAAISRNETWTILAQDEHGNLLDEVTLTGPSEADTVWDAFLWGGAPWGGPGTFFFQQPLIWRHSLVFKQMTIAITGNSALGTIVSNLNMEFARLGYLTQYPSVQPQAVPPAAESVLLSDIGVILTGDDGVTILLSDP